MNWIERWFRFCAAAFLAVIAIGALIGAGVSLWMEAGWWTIPIVFFGGSVVIGGLLYAGD